ncbi:response regulator [Paraflavitalea sp. CAU 1676]|uniref:LytR/AlgR family response regulator transcription factor n=1 Tax=Paraflavitalea sp. CAU 1676 TaxID=3032598 RepID=UPI0023DB3520|nr:response regulator [Paraflavitalea sp. CAU 1676]MDF2187469.1 response regulator [Paraflavitalea sp. CAU 1676]
MPTEKINILIVEDESIVALDLAAGLEKDGYQVVGIADNSEEAKELYNSNKVDILLMDVNIIGDKDGIDTAIELLQYRTVPVIFLTAYTDAATVNRVKHLQAAAFLTKPYNITNVRIAIELAISNFALTASQPSPGKVIPIEQSTERAVPESTEKETVLQMNEYIFVKNNYVFVKIRLADLLYIEADNNYINVITAEKKFVLRLSLSQLLDKINYKPLVRIHRSYAVNIHAIQSFNDQEVQINKTELPIGRNYKEEFLRNFNFR